MPLDLTIAIPVHNDAGPLTALLARLAALDLAQDIIIADDGSDSPLDAKQLARASGLPLRQLTVLRQDTPRGAGAARNLALTQARSRHLLYLDADDLPTRALRSLCAALEQAAPFDFCLFQHHDSRMGRDHLWGQMPYDQHLWQQAGLTQGALRPVGKDAARHLVQTSNYPWNKIYRTSFLQTAGIRCSETLVHNDIALHWQSFLRAQSILASDHVGVIHFVEDNGGRLTNRTGAERLQVFEPLEQIAAETRERKLYRAPFLEFSLGLLLWAYSVLDPELQPQFRAKAASFLSRNSSPALPRSRFADWDRAQKLFGAGPVSAA